jgi:dimethylargininase
MKTAITRAVSPTIGNCQLTYMSRQPIDYEKAVQQHAAYRQALRDMDLEVICLPAESELPDAAFVEDNALVLDEVAVIGATSVSSRKPELRSMNSFLQRYRQVHSLGEDVSFEGGDVIRQGRTLYVGESGRTCSKAISRLSAFLECFNYAVKPVKVSKCLHLSTGASFISSDTILVNPEWIDHSMFSALNIVTVPEDEPWAANALALNGSVLMPDGFPKTRQLLADYGFLVRVVDVSEFLKAEAGVTCLVNILEINQNSCVVGTDQGIQKDQDPCLVHAATQLS